MNYASQLGAILNEQPLTSELFILLFMQPHVIRSVMIDKCNISYPVHSLDDFIKMELGTIHDYYIYKMSFFNKTLVLPLPKWLIRLIEETLARQSVVYELKTSHSDSRLLRNFVRSKPIQKLIELGVGEKESGMILINFINEHPYILQECFEDAYFPMAGLNSHLQPVYNQHTHRTGYPPSVKDFLHLLKEYFSLFDWLTVAYWAEYGQSIFSILPTNIVAMLADHIPNRWKNVTFGADETTTSEANNDDDNNNKNNDSSSSSNNNNSSNNNSSQHTQYRNIVVTDTENSIQPNTLDGVSANSHESEDEGFTDEHFKMFDD